jgi:Protein of unknown function (DUF3175)
MGKGARARWSQRVTGRSDAFDLDRGVFAFDDPRAIARLLKRSAERSWRRKAGACHSATWMFTFSINREGKTLPAARSRRLERAKDEWRVLFGKPKGRHAS